LQSPSFIVFLQQHDNVDNCLRSLLANANFFVKFVDMCEYTVGLFDGRGISSN